MSEQLFDVVFFGILQTGKDKETVMQNMAAMFNTDAAKLAPYFAGGRKVIKGKINAATAEKYRAALENVGLVIKIEECAVQTASPSTAVNTQENAAAKNQAEESTIDTAGITVAPVGADVIEHPVAVTPQKIEDISSITMAEPGADVLDQPTKVIPQKIEDISGITMAEPGADVLDHPTEVIPQEIEDISSLSMAEPGADIIENPKPEARADIPDTSDLSLDDETR